MADSVDVLVIGGGAIGLAVARSLALAGREVLLVERNAGPGLETSSRNSEVIHSGIYYPPGSLKARLCVEGRKALYDYCADRGVTARALGKLIVAVTEAEVPKLHALHRNARANGVDDLSFLSGAEATALEPALSCRAALLSPSTGILDSHGYMLALQGDAEVNGATVAMRTSFAGAAAAAHGFAARFTAEDGGGFELSCRAIVNCAGHGAHAAAAAIKPYPRARLPPRFLAKGRYCSVSGASPFRRLIYPIPVPGALGIHVTLDLGNRLRLGPDIVWVDRLDYDVDPGITEPFRLAAATYWPGIAGRDLAATTCGIRPKVHGPAEAFADFIIQGPADHGVPGLVNLFGIESPGLTSSPAIAAHVRGLLDGKRM